MSKRKLASRILIFAGLALMLGAAAYEAVGYPWKILFTDAEALNVDTLPDPSPPDMAYIDDLSASEDDPYAEPAPTPDGQAATPAPEESAAILPAGDDSFINAKPKPAVSLPPLELLGAVKIPKLGISVNLFEGQEKRELLAGCGHTPQTPHMGQKGNCVVSGHRVTNSMHPFRHLDKMEPGDIVILKNSVHTYTYTTLSTFVVKNTENWVMYAAEDIEYCLTLITCHPVGSARERLILRAELTAIDDMTPAEFFAAPAPSETPPDVSAEPFPSGQEPLPPSVDGLVSPDTASSPPDPSATPEPIVPSDPGLASSDVSPAAP